MQQQSLELNLARKLRPKTFNEVIGQDLSIRILKNSLYLKKFFPVYIFSGQRGCGKTTTARILAAAINCEKLSSFQDDPKQQGVPCLSCFSCNSMGNLSHPDFIEIDAASHTGVDNVRQILDSAAHIPLVGGRKIYLIDEAHMLSKAAFNAFLKILEEPPASVLFILATTELQKIPDTVRSRSFQLFFNSVNFENLKKHLFEICKKENVEIDDVALDLLVGEAEGSVRDSINLLERVRLASDRVSEDVVLKMLGKISYVELFGLWDILLEKDPQKLLGYLTKISFEKVSPQSLWDMMILLCRTLLWFKYGVKDLPGLFGRHLEALEKLSEKCSAERLNSIMQIFWSQEVGFLRTNKKTLFLETVLLQICRQVNVVDLEELIKNCSSNGGGQKSMTLNETTKTVQEPLIVSRSESVSEGKFDMQRFVLEKVGSLRDPLLLSIFKQARILGFDQEKKRVKLQLLKDGAFFRDKIEESLPHLVPIFEGIFHGCVGFMFVSGEDLSPNNNLPSNGFSRPVPGDYLSLDRDLSSDDPVKPASSGYVKTSEIGQVAPKVPSFPKGGAIGASGKEQWPKASLIARFFPGRIEKG